MQYDVVITGAGLTGLTAGFYLKRRGKRVLIIDPLSRPGGVINTVRERGFVYETGPNTGVLSTPEMATLFDDLEGKCKLEKATPTANSRWIWKAGKWNPLPSGLGSAATTPLFTLKDKFRILLEPFRRRGNDPTESVASLVRRRMGESFLDYAVDPFISGIYAGNPDYLVTRYALPKLYNLEQRYGSFIRGGVAKKFQDKSPYEAKATREVFSAEGGLSSLTDALAESAGTESLLLGCSNIAIDRSNGKFITSFVRDGVAMTAESDFVITTCGSHCLPSLLRFAGGDELKDIITLEYARVVQVIAGYSSWKGKPLDGFGGLVPSKECRDILGILFTSSFLRDRAPEGGALLSVFMGGIKRPEMESKSDEEIREIALSEIGAMLNPGTETPDLLNVFRYPYAIPQYGASSARRLMAIEALENRYPGLVLAGNLRDGIGMADRVRQAVAVANLVP